MNDNNLNLNHKVIGSWRCVAQDGTIFTLKFYERNVIYHSLLTNGDLTPFEDYLFGTYSFDGNGKLLISTSQAMGPLGKNTTDFPFSISSSMIQTIDMEVKYFLEDGVLKLVGFEKIDDEREEFKYFDPTKNHEKE